MTAPVYNTVEDFVNAVDAGALILVDVRDHSEVSASGTLKGACHVPLMRLADCANATHPDYDARLNPEKPVAVYCAAGGRAAHAVSMLEGMGYKSAFNVGGFGSLAAQGVPVAK